MITIKCKECRKAYPFSEKVIFCDCGRMLTDEQRSVPHAKTKARFSRVEQAMAAQNWTKAQAEDWLGRRDGML